MWFFAICGFWGCPINKMMKNKVKEHKNRHHLVVSFLKKICKIGQKMSIPKK